MKTALVLSGGGARGAYQVGVLKAIADLHPKHAKNPFTVISGTSAGAINAVALASSANNFRLGIKKVEKIWSQLHIEQVVESGVDDILINTLHLIGSLFNSGIARKKPVALLNNGPLHELLNHVISFKNIEKRINEGYLDAVGVSATSYATGNSVTFFQAHESLRHWRRNKRIGVPANLCAAHLLASSALPGIFPAEKIGRQFFGDGSLRQLSPLSPALKLGGERVVVIGTRGANKSAITTRRDHIPSLAQTIGHIFNSAFVDTLENDLEQLMRLNEMVGILQNEAPRYRHEKFRFVDTLVIRPSIDFDELAAEHVSDLPRGIRLGLYGLGARKSSGGGNLASYVLFQASYCNELIRHGYEDAMAMRDTIQSFFHLDAGLNPAVA